MSDVTRRESLKSLAIGAVVVLRGETAAAANAVDVAAERMAKGHS